MEFHVWSHPMIETVDRKLIAGNLGGKAKFTSIDNAEIGVDRWGIVVGDIGHVDLEWGSKTVESSK
jgi:hypothetical protein